MNVNLIAHTQLSGKFLSNLPSETWLWSNGEPKNGESVALTAIRTCYSANKPSEIVAKEGAKYFGKPATDGEGGTEADRLIRHIVRSKHLSTLEHLTFTFAIEGVSRALLAQLTRHRVGFSFSVQSQRYVRFGSDDKSGGFDYVTPDSIEERVVYQDFMEYAQETYDKLRKLGVPAEDARMVLPQAATTNLVMTANLRALLDFYAKRRPGNGAQAEIADLAECLKAEIIAVEPWTAPFFKGGDAN